VISLKPILQRKRTWFTNKTTHGVKRDTLQVTFGNILRSNFGFRPKTFEVSVWLVSDSPVWNHQPYRQYLYLCSPCFVFDSPTTSKQQFSPSLRSRWKQLFCYQKEFKGKGSSGWGVSVLREGIRVQVDKHTLFDQRPCQGFHPLPMQWWCQIYPWGRYYRQSHISYVNSKRWIDLFLRELH